MKLTPSLIASISVAVALSSWAGVAFFAASIGGMTQDVAVLERSAQAKDNQQTAALKAHALAQEIAPLRTQLEATLQTDPISLAGLITQAGKDAGVALRVSNASPDNMFRSNTASGHAALQATVVGFTAGADGSFDTLIRAGAFLEILAVPSAIQELDFGRTTGAPASSWHMDTRIQMLTASPISS